PDDLEYFGNSWVSQDEGTPNFVFRSLVGWGSTGNWNAQGSHNVQIDSSSAGCPGSANVAVKTEYHFFDNGASANKFRVRRVFNFGNTAFPYNFRPYIPRLYPRTSYSQVLHPNAAGNALLTENSTPCDFGCQVSDWNQTWFAIHDPATGKGMIVKHKSSTPAVLWVDQDETSDTAASSVLLLQPRRGFTRRIVEKEDFCFYDRILWTPSLRLPRGC
ncbi:MAG TPA: hypothetical protein VFD70_11810, partial [Anaerolineae bacterium]|nr:hypothetical protein [Anaerolineae bacterium]